MIIIFGGLLTLNKIYYVMLRWYQQREVFGEYCSFC
jgi:hypothetical protein